MRIIATKPTELIDFSRTKLKLKRDSDIGIYAIICEVSMSVYIGQSKNITGRLKNHKSILKSGIHPSKRMQMDYKLHGAESFKFEAIHECELDHLLHWETSFIKEYKIKGYDPYNLIENTEDICLITVTKEQKKIFERLLKVINNGKMSIDQLESAIDQLT